MDQAPTFDPIPDEDEAPVLLPRTRGRALPLVIIVVVVEVALAIAWGAYRRTRTPR
jgi:hypothetical protein